MAYVRLREKIDRSWTIKLLNRFGKIGKRDLTNAEIGREKAKVLKELQKSREDSFQEKTQILKNRE